MDSKRELALLKRLRRLQLKEAFDPNDVESRPTIEQDTIMRDSDSRVKVVRAGNQSGKTALGAKELVLKFLEEHPYWKRNPEWGHEPLNLVVSSTGHQQIVDIWEQKIEPFLDASVIKVEKDKGYLKRVVHKESGNKIIFIPHNVDAQQKTQGLVCHHFWIDEMPKDKAFVDEALERVQSKKGQLVMTFTPTVTNEEIREFCDNMPESLGKMYMINRLQNPVYADRIEELLSQYEGLPENVKRMRLYGEWMKPSGAVFVYNKDKVHTHLPEGYSKMWHHFYAIDPAYSGYTGYCLMARDPKSGQVWLVDSGYFEGQAPSDLVKKSEEYMAGYNIKRRIVDPHETAFKKEAAKLKIFYSEPYKKTQRKRELIRKIQDALATGSLLINAKNNSDAIREFDQAVWKDSSEGRFVNAQKYHICDSVQYCWDKLPPFNPEDQPRPPESRDAYIIRKHNEQLAAAAKRDARRSRIKSSRRRRR